MHTLYNRTLYVFDLRWVKNFLFVFITNTPPSLSRISARAAPPFVIKCNALCLRRKVSFVRRIRSFVFYGLEFFFQHILNYTEAQIIIRVRLKKRELLFVKYHGVSLILWSFSVVRKVIFSKPNFENVCSNSRQYTYENEVEHAFRSSDLLVRNF